ncbi:MAG: pyrroline-5-carboxylate reductase, partial [Proteobacteria bacterium]
MSQAIIKALIDSGVVPVSNLFATNRSPGKLKKLEETLGVTSVN